MQRSLHYYALLFILITSTNYVFAITATYSLNSRASNNIKNIANENCVVFININDTIITPKSAMFRYQDNPYRNFIYDLYYQIPNVPRLSKGLASYLQNRKIMLVETEWVKFIEHLQHKKAVVIGVYHSLINENNFISNYEDKLHQELNSLGITFTEQLLQQSYFQIGDKENNIRFYQGILFSGHVGKSKAIKELINLLPESLNTVIVIDNDLGDIKKITRALRVFDINLNTLNYLAEQKITNPPNAAIIEIQHSKLLNDGIWLEDDEAVAYLQ